MDGFPVVIRTLDPPLHEFLPKREDLMVDVAILPYADIKKKKELVAKYHAVRRRSEDPQDRAAQPAAPRGRASRVQPHARTSRLPPGHHLSRDHGDAGARHFRSCRAGGQEGQEGDSGSHDSADRRRQGTGKPEEDRGAGGGGSPRQGRHEKPEIHGGNHDRDSARRADRRRSGQGSRVLQLRH